MKQYGKKKTKTKVKGHQECGVCHPDSENDRAARARQSGKANADKEFYDYLCKRR